jgi:hypothetical protein
MKNIIATSKTTDLIIQVTYMDSHITKGFVLVGDTFNKVGVIDYWSTSSFNISKTKNNVNPTDTRPTQ